MKAAVSVLELAEFVHRRGDLHPPLDGRTRPEEGIAAQRRLQAGRGGGYVREQRLDAEIVAGGIEFTVTGRVDGFVEESRLVEEIKTTRTEPHVAQQHLGSVHWAQLRLYGALLARERDQEDTWNLHLVYCHPDTLAGVTFDETHSAAQLEAFLLETLEVFASWLHGQRAYVELRDRRVDAMPFPYGGYRPHQQALARRVFQAFRNEERLLLEAPTGSGKTMGVLYPAVKALAAGHARQLFFMTSRGTGARAALDACSDLGGSEPLRCVELVAREKACAVPGTPCNADRCDYARGYYDRVRSALPELLAARWMDRDAVREVAERHRLCPFELSLDAASWADVVIGDYNYILDPVVRLQRFTEDPGLGLLIDESHQLAERTRSMLSLELDRHTVRAALGEPMPDKLRGRIRGIDNALLALRRSASAGEMSSIEAPQSLLRAISRVWEVLAEEAPDLEPLPATLALVFELSRWIRSESWRTAAAFEYFLDVSPAARGTRRQTFKPVTVRLECLDPSEYIARVLAGYGPHVRFSGTLTPLALQQRLHGFVTAPAERLANAFTPEQLAVLVVDDLSVLYRDRAATLTRLVELTMEVVQAKSGRYLVALPSFEYLDDFVARLRERHPGLTPLVQRRGMEDAERSDFLEDLGSAQNGLGVVVLGGIFGESIDLGTAALAGVVCVGVGLPPAEPVREAMATHFERDADAELGQTVAYRQPAMSKVLQMAGRLLRGPGDRGVICLIDGRFRDPRFQQFFPAHWQACFCRAAAVPSHLENFWRDGEAFPRLAASAAAPTTSHGPSTP